MWLASLTSMNIMLFCLRVGLIYQLPTSAARLVQLPPSLSRPHHRCLLHEGRDVLQCDSVVPVDFCCGPDTPLTMSLSVPVCGDGVSSSYIIARPANQPSVAAAPATRRLLRPAAAKDEHVDPVVPSPSARTTTLASTLNDDVMIRREGHGLLPC